MPYRFSLGQVNRYLLHKQHLTPASQGRDLLSVVRDSGPVRGVPPMTPYISLWARVANLQREWLDAALYQERSLVRIPCMHARLYIVPSTSSPAYYQASRSFLQEGLCDLDLVLAEARQEAIEASSEHFLWSEELAHRVLEIMSTQGPCTIDELAKFLPELKTRVYHDPDDPDLGYSLLGTRLLPAMCAEGLLVRAQPHGGWRSSLYRYATWSSWLPEIDLHSLSPVEARQQVILDYVAAFGPVTIGDIAHWLGGLRRQEIVSALMALDVRLARVQIGGLPGDYFMLQEQLDALARTEVADAVVCLLPPRDSYSMAYSDGRRFVAELYRERVFDRAGESLGTVWLGAEDAPPMILGIWHLQPHDERILVRFFEPVSPDALADVGESAYRLAQFLGFPTFDIDMRTFAEEEAEPPSVSVVATGHLHR